MRLSSPGSWGTISDTTATSSRPAQAPRARPGCSISPRAGRYAWWPSWTEGWWAILNPYFPGSRLTHGLYLKELYVTDGARSKGVGERLIEAIRALARKRGDSQVRWTTGARNTGAQKFYDRLGMRREEKVYYVMDV